MYKGHKSSGAPLYGASLISYELPYTSIPQHTTMRYLYFICLAAPALLSLVSAGEPGESEKPSQPDQPGQPCAPLCDLPPEIAECEDTLLQEQRQAAAAFTGAYADKDVDAMMSYVLPDYIQHNPNIHSGRDIAHKYLKKRLSDPGIVNDVTRVISDLNFIMVHVHRTQPGKKDRALADVYRFDGTCIAEHWDVQEDMEENAPNPLAWF